MSERPTVADLTAVFEESSNVAQKAELLEAVAAAMSNNAFPNSPDLTTFWLSLEDNDSFYCAACSAIPSLVRDAPSVASDCAQFLAERRPPVTFRTSRFHKAALKLLETDGSTAAILTQAVIASLNGHPENRREGYKLVPSLVKTDPTTAETIAPTFIATLVRDTNRDVRKDGFQSLQVLIEQTPSTLALLKKTLIQEMKADDAYARKRSCKLLPEFAKPNRAADLTAALSEATQDRDPEVRAAAFNAAEKLADICPESIPTLLTALEPCTEQNAKTAYQSILSMTTPIVALTHRFQSLSNTKRTSPKPSSVCVSTLKV